MSDKPREFWIDPQKHDCLQMVFEKSVDGCIHVQEVLPSKPNKIVQLLQMSHLFQRDENINLTADRDKWRGIAAAMSGKIKIALFLLQDVKHLGAHKPLEQALSEYEKECGK